jgi:hypothetical protein
MTRLSKAIATAVLFLSMGSYSMAAQAQCSPTNPDCRPPTQPRTGGGSSGGGGGVGVKVDVGSVVKGVGGLFKKKKKKPVEQKAPVVTAPVAQPKQEIVFVKNKPAVTVQPKRPVVRTAVQPRPAPVRVAPAPTRTVAPVRTAARPQVVRKVSPARVAVPVAAAAAVVAAAPAAEPEIVAEVPAPAPEVLAPEVIAPVAPEPVIAPVAKAAVAAPEKAPEKGNGIYLMIAGAVAALAAAGAAAKFMFTPKVTMNCAMPEATSHMVSAPSVSPPEVAFNVEIPGFSASTPSNLAIVA